MRTPGARRIDLSLERMGPLMTAVSRIALEAGLLIDARNGVTGRRDAHEQMLAGD